MVQAEQAATQVNGAITELVRLEGVKKHFPVTKGIVMRRTVGLVKAVDGISLIIPEGQTYSLVGESGCGKTTTSRMVLMAEPTTEGEISFQRLLRVEARVQFTRPGFGIGGLCYEPL